MFVDDNFKFDKNGRKSSKRVENTVGKREIARYKKFPLFPTVFSKACFPGASKGVWEWVKDTLGQVCHIAGVNFSKYFGRRQIQALKDPENKEFWKYS